MTMTVAQLLKHDFKSKNNLSLYDDKGKEIYREYSDGYWFKREYNDNGNEIYYETSKGIWYKYDYDVNGNEIYFEDSDGYIKDNRPKGSCDGKVVEIDGKRYQLNELV